jgi:EAL domain-containing protein (putative c-di-GMP-specific phosphodiesterase class I)
MPFRAQGIRLEPVINIHTGEALYQEFLFPRDVAQASAASVQAFFDMAERSGLASWVDRSVLEVALDMLEDDPKLRLGINLGYRLLVESGTFVLRSLRRRKPAVCQRLVIEVTEVGRPESWNVHDVLRGIKDLGACIALDDFGAGVHDRMAPFLIGTSITPNLVKLDGSLIKRAASSRAGAKQVSQVLKHARLIGVSVIAEHIETTDLLQLVCDLGLQFAQGRLFTQNY